MQVQSLGQEDALEKGMLTHFSILAWRIPWTEKTGELQSMGSQRVSRFLRGWLLNYSEWDSCRFCVVMAFLLKM